MKINNIFDASAIAMKVEAGQKSDRRPHYDEYRIPEDMREYTLVEHVRAYRKPNVLAKKTGATEDV